MRASHGGACPLATPAATDGRGFASWERDQDEGGHVHSKLRPGHCAATEEMLCWLALHTGDEDFMNLAVRALVMEQKWANWRAGRVTVTQPVVGYDIVGGEVRLRLGEARTVRWSTRDDESRAHNWRRLFMYLAGHKRAASMTHLPIEGAPVLHASLLPVRVTGESRVPLPGWWSLVAPRRPPLAREPPTSIRGRSFREHLARAERRGETAWSEVWWTKPGSAVRHGYSRVRLPQNMRARRGTVRRQLLAADRAARAWVAPKTAASGAASARRARMRLDDYAAHVVAYLLLEGFAAVPPHPPGEAAAAFAGCGHGAGTAIALYKHRDAARKLIAGWQTVGTE